MSEPKIVAKYPIKVTLEKEDEKFWCACGLSDNQPFCDGSHSSTDISPLKFVAIKSGDAHLCLCKHSKNPPYCDGAHTKLP